MENNKNGVIVIIMIRTCHLADFTITTDDRMKIKGNKMIDRYLDLAREQTNCRTWG